MCPAAVRSYSGSSPIDKDHAEYVERKLVTKTEKIDQTLLWSLRGFGLLALGLVAFVVVGTIIVFVATLIFGY